MVALKEGCSRRALAANWGDLVAARSSSDSAVLALVFCEKMHCPYSDLRVMTGSLTTWQPCLRFTRASVGSLALVPSLPVIALLQSVESCDETPGLILIFASSHSHSRNHRWAYVMTVYSLKAVSGA